MYWSDDGKTRIPTLMRGPRRLYLCYVKPCFDLALVFPLLVILILPMICIAIAIVIFSGNPILFKQQRIGRFGKTFVVYKFRTMAENGRSNSTITVRGDSRVTWIGRILRKFKFDELPQLFNVFKGEMSFVGPRPDVPGYADRLTGEERKILDLKPGITGPATLAFRNEEEILGMVSNPQEYNNSVIFPEKVRMNLDYYYEASFCKDLHYLMRTLRIERIQKSQ